MKNLLTPVLLACLLLLSRVVEAQIPAFESYPSATAVVYLDFDGQTVDATSWNSNGPIFCGPSNLTTDQITEICNRVSEDFRPFNINITTDSTRYWAAPPDQRMRIILTITSSWYGRSGGVSFMNSFNWGDNTPAFVFTALLKGNTKNIAEAASHEAGHTFGLRHQAIYDSTCVKKSDYNSGTGAGETGWAPIMGVGYYKNYTLWHNGADPYGCTEFQDDLSIITDQRNGFGYRTDDYDSSFQHAYNLTFSGNEANADGLISTATDKDMFRFKISHNGHFRLQAVPYHVNSGDAGANLDVQLKLYNSAEQLIGTYNPADLLSAAVDTTLDSGNYFYSISGSANQFASDYASLGSYSIQSSFTENALLALRQLKLQGVEKNHQHLFNWIINADETLVKQTLEASTDGVSFHSVTELQTDVRSYSYQPSSTNTTLQYRLNVAFDNGRQYFSNIILLRSNELAQKPQLLHTLVQSNRIMVRSPSDYRYIISDYSGRTLMQGNLKEGENTITVPNLISGLYLIQYTNQKEQYTEKLIKQ